MSKKTIYAIGLVAASLLLLLGVAWFSRAAIKREVNGWRAERLYGEAAASYAGENYADAARKGTAAFYLDREEPKIQLLVARALLKQRSIAAVAWWKLVLEQPDLPVDDLRELTRLLINSRRYEEALPYLERLVELDSNAGETQALWLRALNAQRQVSQTWALAETLVNAGTDDWQVHQQYLQMQRTGQGQADSAQWEAHLLGLIDGKGPLAVVAARELIQQESASAASRRLAADYLAAAGGDPVDQLMVQGLRLKLGDRGREAVPGILRDFLAGETANRYQSAIEWAFWVDAREAYLDQVDWATYRDSGATAEFYVQALLQAGRNADVLAIAQERGSLNDSEAANFLVFRIMALQASGKPDEARATLQHATEVTSPDNSRFLERYLLQQQEWDLLVKLYDNLLEDNPDDPGVLMRRIGAFYYTGQQDRVEASLQGADFGVFEQDLGALGLIAYLQLILSGATPELHREIESLLARYPDIFDFRLIAGLSYLLQGNAAMAGSFAENMPELSPAAPRHLRVCAALLQQRTGGLFSIGEMETFLPRERLLLSRIRE